MQRRTQTRRDNVTDIRLGSLTSACGANIWTCCVQAQQGHEHQQQQQLFGRNLHILSHMLRYLCHEPDVAETRVHTFTFQPGPTEQDDEQGVPIVTGLLSLLTQMPAFEAQAQDRMLIALGQLLIGHPASVMLSIKQVRACRWTTLA